MIGNKLNTYITNILPIYGWKIFSVAILFLLLYTIRYSIYEREQIALLERPRAIEGVENKVLYYEYNGEFYTKDNIDVNVFPKEWEKKEKKDFLIQQNEGFKKTILSQYDNLHKITGALEFPTQYKKMKIVYDNHLFQDGWFPYDKNKREYHYIVSYVISYQGERIEDEVQVTFKKEDITNKYIEQYVAYFLKKDMERNNEEVSRKEIVLKKNIDGIVGEISYYEQKELQHPIKIVFIVGILIVALSILMKRKIQEKEEVILKEKRIQLATIIKQYVLLHDCGLILQKSFYYSILNASKGRMIDEKNREVLENIKMWIENNEGLTYVLKVFCEYYQFNEGKKFARLLLHNLELGDSLLTIQLRELSEQMWEERIYLAKKEGEKASSKLIIPIVMILCIVITLTIIPTFMAAKI